MFRPSPWKAAAVANVAAPGVVHTPLRGAGQAHMPHQPLRTRAACKMVHHTPAPLTDPNGRCTPQVCEATALHGVYSQIGSPRAVFLCQHGFHTWLESCHRQRTWLEPAYPAAQDSRGTGPRSAMSSIKLIYSSGNPVSKGKSSELLQYRRYMKPSQ